MYIYICIYAHLFRCLHNVFLLYLQLCWVLSFWRQDGVEIMLMYMYTYMYPQGEAYLCCARVCVADHSSYDFGLILILPLPPPPLSVNSLCCALQIDSMELSWREKPEIIYCVFCFPDSWKDLSMHERISFTSLNLYIYIYIYLLYIY